MNPYELHDLNKPGPSATPVTPAPGYDPRADSHTAGLARSHYYQVPIEVPRAKPWYKRKACMISSVIVGIILLLAVIAVGLTVVFVIRDNDDDDKDDAVTTAIPVLPTTTEIEPSTMTVTSIATITPSIHTVTLTESAPGSSEPSTIIQTITASEPEDFGKILSSLFTRYPYYTTKLTTEVITLSNTLDMTVTREVTQTEQPRPTSVVLTTQVITLSDTVTETRTSEITITEKEEPPKISLVTITGPKTTNFKPTTIVETATLEPTTVITTATIDSPSTFKGKESSIKSDETSSTESSKPTGESSASQEPTTLSTTTRQSSSSTSTTSAESTSSGSVSADFGIPTLSNSSSLAAVDVVNAPSSLKRRLLVWQDDDDNLIARDAASGESSVNKIDSFLQSVPKGRTSTPLTATVDDKGQIHIFYITKDSKIHHISQQEKNRWTDNGTPRYGYSARSMLAAAWHESSNNTKVLTLTLMYDWPNKASRQNAIEVFFSADYGETWQFAQPQAFKDIRVPADGDYGISVASGIAWDDDGDDMDEPEEGEFAGLHFILEGKDGLQVVECEFENNNLTDCNIADRQFHIWEAGKGVEGEYVPIGTESHPSHLAWSQHRSNPNGPPKLYGLFRLDAEGGELVEFTYVTGIEGETSGGTTVLHESMNSRSIYYNSDNEVNWMRAVASTEERALFLRGGKNNVLQERVLLDGLWEYVGEIDTALTTDPQELFLGRLALAQT